MKNRSGKPAGLLRAAVMDVKHNAAAEPFAREADGLAHRERREHGAGAKPLQAGGKEGHGCRHNEADGV